MKDEQFSMVTPQRWRVIFGKEAPIKYISHLDLCQTWERVFRRAGVRVAYTQGFNPQARLQLAAALPVGYTSRAEMMDALLEQPMEAAELLSRLLPALPGGLTVTNAREVDLKAASLQSSLRRAEYQVNLSTALTHGEIASRIATFLSAEHFEQSRMRKQRVEVVDLRPMVDDIRLESRGGGEVVLWMRVSAGALGNSRPETVVEALVLAAGHLQIERTKLLFEFDSPPSPGYNALS